MNAKAFTPIIRIQIAVAIVAILVTIGCLVTLGPLIKRQADLKRDIGDLNAQVGGLQSQVSGLQGQVKTLEFRRDELTRLTNTLADTARPVPAQTSSVVGWLYVGRLGDTGHWAPASEGVFPYPDPGQTKNISELRVTRNTPITDNSDGDVPLESKYGEKTQPTGPLRLARSGSILKVLKLWTQPSVGNGKFVWAMVNVASDQLLEIPGS